MCVCGKRCCGSGIFMKKQLFEMHLHSRFCLDSQFEKLIYFIRFKYIKAKKSTENLKKLPLYPFLFICVFLPVNLLLQLIIQWNIVYMFIYFFSLNPHEVAPFLYFLMIKIFLLFYENTFMIFHLYLALVFIICPPRLNDTSGNADSGPGFIIWCQLKNCKTTLQR